MLIMREVNEILPRKVIGLRKGEGSFIFIDLEAEEGEEVSLWVYMCDWELVQGVPIITSHDIGDAHDLSKFCLGELVEIEKDNKAPRVCLSFSAGVELILSNEGGFYSADDDYFMLFVGDSWVAKYSELNGFSIRQQ